MNLPHLIINTHISIIYNVYGLLRKHKNTLTQNLSSALRLNLVSYFLAISQIASVYIQTGKKNVWFRE